MYAMILLTRRIAVDVVFVKIQIPILDTRASASPDTMETIVKKVIIIIDINIKNHTNSVFKAIKLCKL